MSSSVENEKPIDLLAPCPLCGRAMAGNRRKCCDCEAEGAVPPSLLGTVLIGISCVGTAIGILGIIYFLVQLRCNHHL